MVAVGAQLALQAPINSALGRSVGGLPASLVSFLVGTAILFAAVFATGNGSGLGDATGVPAWQLTGGLIGATYVATATLTVGRIGAGAVAAATVTGQILSSLVVDALGLVGTEVIPLDPARVAGAVMLVAGTALIVRPGAGRPAARSPQRASLPGRAEPDRSRTDLIAVGVVFAAGLLVGVQHPLNAELSDSTGAVAAGLVNFIAGSAVLAAVVISVGQARRLGGIGKARPWQFLGGLIGTVTVVAALRAVPVIGAAGLTAALVTGQLVGSIAIDRAGAFGLGVRRVTAARAAGSLLLLAGTGLCVY
jgi:bacterial/archaeal transporter family-2 protein